MEVAAKLEGRSNLAKRTKAEVGAYWSANAFASRQQRDHAADHRVLGA
jgi:hypothetical protein